MSCKYVESAHYVWSGILRCGPVRTSVNKDSPFPRGKAALNALMRSRSGLTIALSLGWSSLATSKERD